MNKITALFLLTLCSLCSLAQTHRYEIRTGNFTAIKLYDNVNVRYRCVPDSAGMAVFDAPGKLADKYLFTVTPKGELKIQLEPEYAERKDMPTVTVYSNFLTYAENSSENTLEIISPAPAAEFKCKLVGNGCIKVSGLDCMQVYGTISTGNGRIELSGKCTDFKARMVGTGFIQADGLTAENVTCRIMGTGSICCAPTKELKVRGIGTTRIYYSATPDLMINKKGGGRLFPISSGEFPIENVRQ